MLKLKFKNSDLLIKELKETYNTELYYVGGCVRDLFLNKLSKDIDIVIPNININELIGLLGNYGDVDLVGKSFGVIKFRPTDSDMDYDIAVPRTEESNGDKHTQFDVNIENVTLEDDLFRRDFTINAMAMDIHGNLIDPFNGLDDLINKKQLNVINDNSFKDDPLRILRGLQFSARFNLSLSVSTIKSIHKNKEGLKHITKERVRLEFQKALGKGDDVINRFYELLESTSVLDVLFGKNRTNKGLFREKIKDTDSIGEFLQVIGIPYQEAENNIELTREDVKLFKSVNKLRELIIDKKLSYNKEIATKIFDVGLYNSDIYQINNFNNMLSDIINDFNCGLYPKTYKDLPIKGEDLVKKGLVGKEIGETLNRYAHNVIYYGKVY